MVPGQQWALRERLQPLRRPQRGLDTLILLTPFGSSNWIQQSIGRIQRIYCGKLNPLVVIFEDFKGGIVYLRMQGACGGCPSATMTLKQGIEARLKHFIPEIVGVEAVL